MASAGKIQHGGQAGRELGVGVGCMVLGVFFIQGGHWLHKWEYNFTVLLAPLFSGLCSLYLSLLPQKRPKILEAGSLQATNTQCCCSWEPSTSWWSYRHLLQPPISLRGEVFWKEKETQTKQRKFRPGSSHEAGTEQPRSQELCPGQGLQVAFLILGSWLKVPSIVTWRPSTLPNPKPPALLTQSMNKVINAPSWRENSFHTSNSLQIILLCFGNRQILDISSGLFAICIYLWRSTPGAHRMFFA